MRPSVVFSEMWTPGKHTCFHPVAVTWAVPSCSGSKCPFLFSVLFPGKVIAEPVVLVEESNI